MSQRTNEADIAAVTEVVRAYYDGAIEGDAAKLGAPSIRGRPSSATRGASCTGRTSKSSWPSARGQSQRRGRTNGEWLRGLGWNVWRRAPRTVLS